MDELYNSNKDFRDYVDRYCKNKPITPEQALKFFHIRLAGIYYKEKEEAKNAIKTD